MSVRVMSAVFDRYPAGGGEMLLALALADVSRDDGVLMINDSVPTLAHKTRQTERGVRGQLRRMEALGWLLQVKASDGGRGRSSTYCISPEWIAGGALTPPGGGKADLLDEAPETRNAATVNPERASGFAKPETRNAATVNPERGSGAYRPIEPNTNTPQPPKGGKPPPIVGKTRRGPSEAITLKTWLAQCAEQGQAPVPESDPVFAYCDRVGIGRDILALHWAEFKQRRSEAAKRQKDWPRAFRNSVRDNWFRLWHIPPGQVAQLTTVGRQALAAQGQVTA